MEEMDIAQQRAILMRKIRRRFMLKAYFLFIAFVLFSVLQWCLVLTFAVIGDFLISHEELSIGALFISLMLMTVFVFVEGIRIAIPLNWLLTFIILQAVIIGTSRLLVMTCYGVLIGSLIFVLLPMFIFILLGSLIKHDFTLDVIILFVLSFVFFVGAVYFITFYVVAKVNLAFYIYAALVYIIVCIFIMYHAQTINGNRYAEMRTTDYLLAALILYVDFLVLYMVITHVMLIAWDGIMKTPCGRLSQNGAPTDPPIDDGNDDDNLDTPGSDR
uniref:Uncharacterized protein n=1 Tax=Glossina brevipalpis TaxID=37001 RepID=A0A1A9W2H8_9MUSC